MTPDSTHHAAPAGAPDSLLGPDDPAPVEIVNPEGKGRAVLTADHAGRAFPRRLMGPHANDPDCDPESALGLAPALLATHIAWDIGIGAVARLVATHLDAPAAIGIYSRLAIDLNRAPGIESSIVVESDRIAIPGNQGISPDDRHARERELFRPYHHAMRGRRPGGAAHWSRCTASRR
jgi:predicted N-formylglutamate amidohydrolase